jgi:MYXO-CTERM domain-containing protein
MKRKESNMNIKTLSMTIAAGSLFATGAMADYMGISQDVSFNVDGTWTSRIYANFSAETDELDAVYGDSNHELTVSGSEGFFNATGTGATAMDNNQAFWSIFPTMEWDSMVSIGMTHSASGGTMSNIGIDFAAFNAGGNISTDNGSWYSTPDQPNVLAVGGRVLIMQLTVADDDHAYGTISIQGKDADASTNWNEDGLAFDTLPAPGALALLGLAGLAARRRRK